MNAHLGSSFKEPEPFRHSLVSPIEHRWHLLRARRDRFENCAHLAASPEA